MKKICEDKIDLALKNIEFARDKKLKAQLLQEPADDDEVGDNDDGDETTLMNLPDSDAEDGDIEDEDTLVNIPDGGKEDTEEVATL